MDSPRLELSNGILFAIFHYRLTLFSIFRLNFVQNRVSNGETTAGKKGECFCPCGTHCQRKDQYGRGIVVRVSRVHMVRAHTSCLMRNNKGEPSSCNLLFFKILFSAPKPYSLCLAAPICTKSDPWLQVAPTKAFDQILTFQLI
jgi:hypothetical protein